MNLFELTLRFKGFPIGKAKARLREIQQVAEADRELFQQKLREDIVRYHQRENSFYKAFSKDTNPETWESLPIMTKKKLQQPLGNRLSHGFNAKNAYINKTSGSSGHPFIFAKDHFCHAMSWAVFIDRYRWYGLDMNRDLQARFYGIPLDKKGYWKERLKDRLGKRYRFPVFDLSEEKLQEFVGHFKRKPFVYLNGYTSSIVLFGKFLKERGIVLKTVCPTLKLCIVTSEMLFKEDEKLLEAVLGVPVVNEYGASEVGMIAFRNSEGEFLINHDDLFVEVVDEQGKTVPNGESGRIVITSLFNRAHPMIRYEIGDMGVLAEESTSSRPILSKLIGRTNDMARLPDGKTVPGLTFFYVTKSVIEDDGNVKEFVVEQHETARFVVLYVSETVISSEKEQQIKNAFATYVGDHLRIDFQKVTIMDRSNRGKLKQFISKL
ncbi:phenylacetate--CoA ligase family protein [Luteirhabdus pelagi]|uniref:phenylacetate--CoA ligase family protein n=1 Tax=Luteirhabdus pelagi TaxID=2792783 RepID=UPI00193A5422|nr:phenylacetate--CoA ligase family protein [Luteirhabdus pelagi]